MEFIYVSMFLTPIYPNMDVNKVLLFYYYYYYNYSLLVGLPVGLQRCTACIKFQIISPYNKTIIDFHGGKYKVILTPYSL